MTVFLVFLKSIFVFTVHWYREEKLAETLLRFLHTFTVLAFIGIPFCAFLPNSPKFTKQEGYLTTTTATRKSFPDYVVRKRLWSLSLFPQISLSLSLRMFSIIIFYV